MRKVPIALAVLIAGTLTTAAVGEWLDMAAREWLPLAWYAAGAAVVSGLIGALLMHFARRRSVGVQAAIVAITAVVAVASGAVVAANQMFISEHDLGALAVVLVAAGTITVAIALVLGDRVAGASRTLAATARRIGSGDFSPGDQPVAPEEFTTLAAELETMSHRLEESLERERALEGSRRELVAWVSHDLRTPLAGIRAMAEALEDGVVSDPETVARYHRSVRSEADRLSALVNDLFELSRINSGMLRLKLEQASLSDLVSDAVAAASGIARAKGVRLNGDVRSPAPELQLSTPEMARVLRNLLENAIRHTPSEGEVRVDTGIDQAYAYVRIADECGGIPAQDLDRVFDTAFSGHSARTPGRDGGAGLGLAIARGIVEAHEGEISVINQERGCMFTVRLPLRPPVATP
jgi:signal transduction histidine kinase